MRRDFLVRGVKDGSSIISFSLSSLSLGFFYMKVIIKRNKSSMYETRLHSVDFSTSRTFLAFKSSYFAKIGASSGLRQGSTISYT